jgi:hypothetical protein
MTSFIIGYGKLKFTERPAMKKRKKQLMPEIRRRRFIRRQLDPQEDEVSTARIERSSVTAARTRTAGHHQNVAGRCSSGLEFHLKLAMAS